MSNVYFDNYRHFKSEIFNENVDKMKIIRMI